MSKEKSVEFVDPPPAAPGTEDNVDVLLGREPEKPSESAEEKPEEKPPPEDAKEKAEEKAEDKAEEKPEEKPAEPKQERLSAALRVLAQAKSATQKLEAERAEFDQRVAQLRAVAEIVDAQRAELERKAKSFETATSDPVGFLAEHGIHPDAFLKALAEWDHTRPVKPRAPAEDPNAKLLEAIAARIEKLERDGPEWLKAEREQRRAADLARERQEAARWFVERAKNSELYPDVGVMLDDEEIVENVAAITRSFRAQNKTVADEQILDILQDRCHAKREQILAHLPQGSPRMSSGAAPKNLAGRTVESRTISGEMTQQRPVVRGRTQAERHAEFDALEATILRGQ